MRWVALGLIFLLSSVVSLPLQATKETSTNKTIYGRLEQISILPEEITLNAKMDTGAKMSSLDAHKIKIYPHKNATWVDFELTPSHYDEKKTLHYKLERYIHIKNRQHESAGHPRLSTRPVIKMKICLGHQSKTIEVNLVNRSHFIYPMLLGRDAMDSFKILIDPSEKYTTEPSCSSS